MTHTGGKRNIYARKHSQARDAAGLVWQSKGGVHPYLADSTLFDCEPCAAQRVDHLRHRTEMEAVSREWQRFHHIRVSHSDNDPTRASHHPS
jgi:hypothetical protein